MRPHWIKSYLLAHEQILKELWDWSISGKSVRSLVKKERMWPVDFRTTNVSKDHLWLKLLPVQRINPTSIHHSDPIKDLTDRLHRGEFNNEQERIAGLTLVLFKQIQVENIEYITITENKHTDGKNGYSYLHTDIVPKNQKHINAFIYKNVTLCKPDIYGSWEILVTINKN